MGTYETKKSRFHLQGLGGKKKNGENALTLGTWHNL